MKKGIISLLLVFSAVCSYAQAGDLFVGAMGGYITHYEDPLYGLNLSYHVNDPIELSLNGLFNSNVTLKDDFSDDSKLKLLSLNLDLHYYMILMRSWATGPTIGGQYLRITDKADQPLLNASAGGFNIGWHFRGNISDTMKAFGGWRYTMAGKEYSHHFFYIGVGYTFSLF
ncbi:MAG: porin family protein [Dysgonamonadaceae bacterium]|jgi:hypothetical protein|nr:porin family protein [Dysgonamonadaceae bacterium]